MAAKFPQFSGYHDPDGDERWQFLLKLDAGRALVSAVIDVVDPLSTVVDSATDLLVSDVTRGLVSGVIWGVTFRVRGGSAGAANAPKEYFIRCRYTDNSTPTPVIGDRTARLLVKQT